MQISNSPKKFLYKVDQHGESIFVHHTKIEEKIPLHEHQKHQMSYVEGGVAFLNTRHNSYFLPARHFIWIPAGTQHNVELRTSVTMVHNFYFPQKLIPTKEKPQQIGIYPVTDLLMEMIGYTEPWNGNISTKTSVQYEFLIALRNVLIAVARNPLAVVLPTTRNEILSPILKYIHLNTEKPLQLPDIAETFGMSGRSLSRLFRQNIDISFLQYVKLTRIIKSMEKLLQTNLSISEIAYSCGYSNVSAFSNAFIQISKVRPGDFRKQNR